MNVPAFTFDQKLVFGWFKSRTLQRWKWCFLIWTVYSGTLTPAPLSPSHLQDIKHRFLNSGVALYLWITESQTAGLTVWMQAVSCRELEDRCSTYSTEAKRSQMGQTLFDEPALSGFKSRLHQSGGWGCIWGLGWAEKIKILFLPLPLMGQ